MKPNHNANYSGFATALNPAGNGLVYSTYLGGTGADYTTAIAVDSNFQASVTGVVGSSDFPVTAGAPQTMASGLNARYSHAFVSTLTANGSSLEFSTYLGGNGYEVGTGVAVDSMGLVYVTGYTGSYNFPTTGTPLQAANAGLTNAFVTKLNPVTSQLVYSTYLGGDYVDKAFGIAVDSQFSAYVTGVTFSDNFPLENPYQATLSGPSGPAGTNPGCFCLEAQPERIRTSLLNVPRRRGHRGGPRLWNCSGFNGRGVRGRTDVLR